MKSPHLPKATELAHQLIRERVLQDDHVIDATVGNGHDTLFLAKCVGNNGAVTGFDIQAQAISKAESVLADHSNVTLYQKDHGEIATIVQTPIKAAMFNLGYLPSGDKNVITQSSSTIPALSACTELLLPGGIITIVIYTGHDGGKAESDAVSEWCSKLIQSEFSVAQYQFINQINHPPHLIAIERK